MAKHPKIDVQPFLLEKVLNLLSIILILSAFVYVVQAYAQLPDNIATHFNAKGEADRWGSKGIIFIMPIAALICFVPMYFLSKAPHLFNYMVEVTEENAPRLYPVARLFIAAINFEVVLIFSVIAWQMVQSAYGDFSLGIEFAVLVMVVPLITIIFFVIRMNRVAQA